VFGRDRPATGFAIDLKALVDEIEPSDAKRSPIVAPRSEDPALLAKMTDLREEGRIVIVDLESNTQVIGVESLVYQAGEWVVVAANEVSE
jgi:ATP phosphoribosyltransferase regulatory subunit